MGKLKVHELAKELGVPSKEILEKAKKLKIEVASHLSNLDDEQANKIRKAYNSTGTANKNVKNNKEKKETPVIIRREVILNEEDENKKEEKVPERKDLGFVKRRNNNDYNIVYRNKPNKPLTVNELFGLGKKEEKPEAKKVQVNEEKKLESKKEEIKEDKKIEEKREEVTVKQVVENKAENRATQSSNMENNKAFDGNYKNDQNRDQNRTNRFNNNRFENNG